MLTKTDFRNWLQCPRYLWLYKFRKDLLPPDVEQGLARLFEEGYEVERYAYDLFPGGVSAADNDLGRAVSRTKKLIKDGENIIFQPTFADGRLFCRADIIAYDQRRRRWNIFEVKGSTEVKDEVHLPDVAFQRLCLEKAGLSVGSVNLVHVNNRYVRRGAIEPSKLLKIEDVTVEAGRWHGRVAQEAEAALAELRLRQEPDVRILKQCGRPYECPFIGHCWRDIPEPSIYDVSLSEEKLNYLLDRGILKLEDVPDGYVTNKLKHRFYHAVKTGEVRIDAQAITDELSELRYPLHFLDYETFNPAIPRYDGYRPYQRIVFQYSLDVQRSPGAAVEHHEFLARDDRDPGPELAAALAARIGAAGSVIAWNASFESGCNREMAERMPAHKDLFSSIERRLWDLAGPFRDGSYVHKDFGGSWSLKKVLPVLVPDLSYEPLAIKEGGAAADSWPKLIDPKLAAAKKQALAADMLAYCGTDTLAMVRILDRLKLSAAGGA